MNHIDVSHNESNQIPSFPRFIIQTDQLVTRAFIIHFLKRSAFGVLAPNVERLINNYPTLSMVFYSTSAVIERPDEGVFNKRI